MMDAGRALDRVIAEKVMGMSIYHYDKSYRDDCYYSLMDAEGDSVTMTTFPFVRGERKTEAEAWDDVPHYSTDLTTAWDHIAMRFIRAGCAAWVEGDGHTGFRAGCTNDRGRFLAEGETPSHAICLAVLKAIGVEA